MRSDRARHVATAAVVAMVLLAGLGAETRMRPRPEEAEPYHARVRDRAAQMPAQVGDWIATDYPPREEAVKLLKPNVIFVRQFTNTRTEREVELLVVQCKDARDIYLHYPPVCYPSQGMELRSAVDADWRIGPVRITGKEYEFDARRIDSRGKLVDNFIIVPGHYARDMDAVGELAGDYTRRFYGAAQVQLVFDDVRRWEPAERRQVFRTLIGAYLPLIEEIRKGDSHEHR